MNSPNTNRRSAARVVALVGIMAATVECGKLALSFVPNVEIVTLLLALYGYVFGGAGIVCAIVFVAIEPLIWGFNTWVISYILYWPFVPVLFMLLGKKGVRKRFVIAAIAGLSTFFFGVLSALVEVGLFSGYFDNFLYRLGVYYARGVVFYVIHVCSNIVIFAFLFPYLKNKLTRIKYKIF